MRKLSTKKFYNSHILCLSSFVYVFAGLAVMEKNPYLAALLLIVAVFSVLYHNNFQSPNLKILDWVFGAIVTLYMLYIIRVQYDPYIFALIIILVGFRLIDHILFKRKRYGLFSYTHSAWHLISGLLIVGLVFLA